MSKSARFMERLSGRRYGRYVPDYDQMGFSGRPLRQCDLTPEKVNARRALFGLPPENPDER